MPKKPQSKNGYGLAADFEKHVAYIASHRPGFLGSIGRIDVDRFDNPACQLLMRAALAIQHDHGKGPSSHSVAYQRLRRWHEEGSCSDAELDMVMDFIYEMESAPKADEGEVLRELAPILSRALQSEAVDAAFDAHRKRTNFEVVKKKLAEAERVGVVDMSVGSLFGMHSFDEIDAHGSAVRLPTGIDELDLLIDGGLPMGAMLTWIASTSGGKSQCMVHATATASRLKKVCCIATLELPVPWWKARVMANLTGVPTNFIMSGEARATAESLLEPMLPSLGRMVFKSFPAQQTTVQDIHDWILSVEQQIGQKVDFVAIDYGDKLASSRRTENESNSNYNAMNTVYEGMRVQIAEKEQRWLHTASQAKRRVTNERTKRLESEDVSDSLNKSRITDVMVSTVISKDSEPVTASYFLAKNRFGSDGRGVGPIPVDLACSRMSPLVIL